jgi:hypothetical protein
MKTLEEQVEEFYQNNREEHLKKTIGTSDFCKSMMSAFHKHALEEKMKEIELKQDVRPDGEWHKGYDAGIRFSIEILNQEK